MTRRIYRFIQVYIVSVCIAALVACGSDSGTSVTMQGNTGDGSGDGSDNSDNELIDGTTDPVADNGSTNQPNILLIITDDQGLDASAQYSLGSDLPNTPVINDLAQNGIVYENVWATPSCTTTRAALLTGKHGVNNGVVTTPGVLSADVGTIQALLESSALSANYETAVFGKWHVAGGNPDPLHPEQLGVGHYAGNLTGNLDSYFDWQVTINGVTESNSTYHTTAIVDYAIDWIGEQNSPWFTWMAFSAPHSPFHAPPAEFNSRNLSGTVADINVNRRDYYLSAIETLDAELGRLLGAMDPQTRQNTVIMIVGDNGTPRNVIDRSVYPINSHGKGSLFEAGVKVPLVISGAGVQRSGARESGLVSIADFYPTIADLAGVESPDGIDGQSIVQSFGDDNAIARDYLYTEYESDVVLGSGWTVRSDTHKFIAYDNGTEALYDLVSDPGESSNLLLTTGSFAAIVEPLRNFGLQIRGALTTLPTESGAALDITDRIADNSSASCADHVRNYIATAQDASTGTVFDASFSVTFNNSECVFTTNAIPNHTFNDGASAFPNPVATQSEEYQVALNPQFAATTTGLSLNYDNAILLNGVKVDLLAAGCFGVGDGRVGCNDDNQPWRFDPMFAQNGFRVDQHNAHTQPDGTYHYHGDPNALFDRSGGIASPVIGFAADGFPVYGGFINDGGNVRAVESSYRLKSGNRPSGPGNPGGVYDGAYRDDYEYVAGAGDLDECNGMSVNGVYGYYVTDSFPHVMACFKGTVDESFRK